MEKDRKTLLLALLIIGVAVFSFNVFDITGDAVKYKQKQVITVTVEPSQIVLPEDPRRGSGNTKLDELSEITVSVKGTVDNEAALKTKTGAVITQLALCPFGPRKCTDPVVTEHVSLKPGKYYVQVTNRNTGAVVRSNIFEVVVA